MIEAEREKKERFFDADYARVSKEGFFFRLTDCKSYIEDR